jgi:hypothetical protein
MVLMKKIILSSISIFLMLMLFPVSNAEQETFPAVAIALSELKTIDVYFGYTESLDSGQSIKKTLYFNPPDWGNESYVVVSLIRVVEEQTGSTKLTISVNGKPCRTAEIASSIGSAQYVADFDCTNVINTTGNYTVNLTTTKSLSNVHFRSWITYVTDLTNQTTELREKIALDVWKKFYGLGTPPLMSSTEYYCENDTILVKNRTVEVCEKNACEFVTGVERINCTWGCDIERNECKSAPYVGVLYALGVVIVLIVLILIFKRYW